MKRLEFLEKLDQYEIRVSDSVKYKKYENFIARNAWAILRLLLLCGLAFILLYPLIYMISMAFRPVDEVFDPAVIWVPRNFTLENFTGVLTSMDYFNSLLQTFKIGILSSLLLIASSCLTGYGFARFSFKGQKLLFGILLFSIIVPPQTLLIPLYLQNAKFDYFFLSRITGFITKIVTGTETSYPPITNILNTPLPFYLQAIFGNGIRSGLLIYIFRQFFAGMPRELEDAAYIDGAGPLKTFWKVMRPNANAAFLTVFLFSTVWYWNDYYYSTSFLSSAQTVSVRLSMLRAYLITSNSFQSDPYKYITQMQAGCLLTILPPLLLYVIFQKYFTESIERTGIVG